MTNDTFSQRADCGSDSGEKTLGEKLQLIERWNGSDSRFYRREGGTAQGTAWVDRFSASNPAVSILTISSLSDMIDLDPGTYRLVWNAHLVFANPVCRWPSERFASMQTRLTRHGSGSGSPFLGDKYIDEVYVCANRDNLIYRSGLEYEFRIGSRQNSVDFSFYAYNDDNSGRPGYTNCREVIIYAMELYRL